MTNTTRLQKEGWFVHHVDYIYTYSTIWLHSIRKSGFRIQESADRLGQMIQKKPVSSYDLAINWLEFLAEFKSLETLQPISRKMSLVKYYMVDVLSVTFGILFLGFFLILKMMKLLCSRICGAKKQKRE